jgi:hypothetical protein
VPAKQAYARGGIAFEFFPQKSTYSILLHQLQIFCALFFKFLAAVQNNWCEVQT